MFFPRRAEGLCALLGNAGYTELPILAPSSRNSGAGEVLAPAGECLGLNDTEGSTWEGCI